MALEEVIRSRQEQLRDGGTSPEDRRQGLLRQLGQQIRRRLVEAAELDPHAPEARDKARALIQRYLEEEESQHRLLVLAPADRSEIEERIVTVEDAAELRFQQVENLARLEARPANIEGRGQITIRDLVRTSLRMRPDRVVVGEVRGGEALDMLQALNTGHDGSLTTAHANSARDLISRLETMVLMSGMELPVSAIRQQIASAVEVIVHLARLPGGKRRVIQVSEVVGMDQGEVALVDLFKWDPTVGPGGELVWTGHELTRTEKFGRFGVGLPRLREVAAWPA